MRPQRPARPLPGRAGALLRAPVLHTTRLPAGQAQVLWYLARPFPARVGVRPLTPLTCPAALPLSRASVWVPALACPAPYPQGAWDGAWLAALLRRPAKPLPRQAGAQTWATPPAGPLPGLAGAQRAAPLQHVRAWPLLGRAAGPLMVPQPSGQGQLAWLVLPGLAVAGRW